MKCIDRINYGMLLRFVLTIISFYTLIKINIATKYLPIILVFLMLALDGADNAFNIYVNNVWSFTDISKCTISYHYQTLDKLLDLFTYILLFLFYKNDNYLLIFVIWRSLGVLMNTLTGNRKWLVLFFDFVKEYLLFKYFFPDNNSYLPFFVIAKIAFEYYLHVYRIESMRS